MLLQAAMGSGLSTFTMAPRRSWMIRDGKLAEPVRVTVISGEVEETLKNIEGCSNKFTLMNSAFGGCGKKRPISTSCWNWWFSNFSK